MSSVNLPSLACPVPGKPIVPKNGSEQCEIKGASILALQTISHFVAIGDTTEIAARNVIAMGRVCTKLHQATQVPFVERVLDKVKKENDALLKIWTEIAGKLDFHENPRPTTLAEIKAWFEDPSNVDQLNAFKELNLLDLKLEAIPPQIAKFTKLEFLDLSHNQIKDISAVGSLVNLKRLFLDNNQISDISAIRPLVQLYWLTLSHNQIKDASAVGSLVRLKSLFLNFNQIANIPATFGTLALLETLDLSNNQIRGLSTVERLTQLKSLHLDGNQIEDIALLRGLSELEELCLSNNKIADITAVRSLVQLRSLYISNNKIADISAVGGHALLEDLFLSNNKIADISAVGSLAHLKTLSLGCNRIKDLTGLSGLTQLSKLYLNWNEIANIDELEGLPLLCWLELDYNPLLCVFDEKPEHSFNNHDDVDMFFAQNREFREYDCQSSLSRFVQFLALGNPSQEALKEQFNRLDDSDKKLIFALVCEFSDVMTDNSNWEEQYSFDDRTALVSAVRKAIWTKYDQLSIEDWNTIFDEVYKRAGSPEIVDSQQWGEEHVFDNVLWLVDAMDRLDRQQAAFPA